MPENNQDKAGTAIPGASIKDSAIELHTHAVDQIREEMKTMHPGRKSFREAVTKVERHETAVQILSRDGNLPPETTSTIPEISHGLTAKQANDAETDIPAYLRSKKQAERKRLDEALKGPPVVMIGENGKETTARAKDVAGGTASSLDPVNFGDIANGEPTRPYSLEQDAGEINNN